jgi:hypothetical protein
MLLNTDQKQQLESKLRQLSSPIEVSGNTIIIKGRRFTFPTSESRVVSSTTTTSR